MRLKHVLHPRDLERVQRAFPWKIANIRVKFHSGDGPGRNRASVPGWCVLVPTWLAVIKFDITDMPLANGKLDISNPRTLETLLHELFHLHQYRRGLKERFNILKWRREFPYTERPHEIEAHEWAHKTANSI